MDNNTFQNNRFQIPSPQTGESFNAPQAPAAVEQSQAEIDRIFTEIVNTRGLQGYGETEKLSIMPISQDAPAPERLIMHSTAKQLFDIGVELHALRTQHHDSIVNAKLAKSVLRKRNI